MKVYILPVIFYLFGLILEHGAKPVDPQTPKEYNVDLDAPAETRWAKVLADYKYMVPKVEAAVRQLIPIEALPLVERIAKDLDKIIPSPFSGELKGVADGFAMDLGEIILLNIIYDATAYCTSIVAQDDQGMIWHARNLDYYYGDILRNLTIVVHFQRKGKIVFSATTFAGYVGIATGQRPNAFTITVDQRGHHIHVGWWWQNILEAILDKSSQFDTFLIREVLENKTNFRDAVDELALRPIHAPVYFIVGGSLQGEGVVITRDRIAAVDRMYMDPQEGVWYVLETNYDHWTTPPPYDNQRRAVAKRSMDQLGQSGVNMTSLYKVMSTNPVMNKNTTYTIVFSAAKPSLYTSWIRWP